MVGADHLRGAGEGLLRPTSRPKGVVGLDDMIAALVELDANGLCLQSRNHLGGTLRPFAALAPDEDPSLSYQAAAFGGLDNETLRVLRQPKGRRLASSGLHPFEPRIATTREGAKLKAGALLAREWNGRLERVMILDKGFAWNGETLRQPVASRQGDDGTSWNGHRFFGLRTARSAPIRDGPAQVGRLRRRFGQDAASTPIKDGGAAFADDLTGRRRRHEIGEEAKRRGAAPSTPASRREHGLEQEFNSLDNQREASEAYIKSQAHEGWKLIRTHYDDGGYSGGSIERPALKRLLDDVRAHRIDVIVVYKVDRLTRSLADFAKLVELFDAHQVSFVSVTQAFNTTTSMGRLTLNVLYPSPSLSARSLASGSETRSPPRRGRASGSGDVVPSDIGSRTGRSNLSRSMPSSCAISFGVISRLAASCGSRRF